MKKQKRGEFFIECIKKMCARGGLMIDIGGSLRIDSTKNNRFIDRPWLKEELAKVDYKILDKVSDFNPDIVGDVHDLPFEDGSIDSVICIAVLEHVEEPQKAVREIYRALKPGGMAMFQAPFIYYYHPEKGYYGDFYRFTHDAWEYMCKDFSHVEIARLRGPFSALAKFIPPIANWPLWFWLDTFKPNSRQVGGYSVFCVK
ncbi:MAG: methyltransferase domain-containing protein [Patescibacteria group bacterium]